MVLPSYSYTAYYFVALVGSTGSVCTSYKAFSVKCLKKESKVSLVRVMLRRRSCTLPQRSSANRRFWTTTVKSYRPGVNGTSTPLNSARTSADLDLVIRIRNYMISSVFLNSSKFSLHVFVYSKHFMYPAFFCLFRSKSLDITASP